MSTRELSETEKKINQAFKDFFTFKINIFPIIVKILYALATIACIIWGFKQVFADRPSGADVMIGIAAIIFGPIILHICFELMLLLFSILDILREIRNNIFKICEKLTGNNE